MTPRSMPGFEVRSEREMRLVAESVADLVLTFDPGAGEIAGNAVGSILEIVGGYSRVELDGYRRLEREILAREGEERIEFELRLEPLSPPPP